MIRRKNSNDKECSVESSLEVGMLSKSTFNDQELDNYLRHWRYRFGICSSYHHR